MAVRLWSAVGVSLLMRYFCSFAGTLVDVWVVERGCQGGWVCSGGLSMHPSLMADGRNQPRQSVTWADSCLADALCVFFCFGWLQGLHTPCVAVSLILVALYACLFCLAGAWCLSALGHSILFSLQSLLSLIFQGSLTVLDVVLSWAAVYPLWGSDFFFGQNLWALPQSHCGFVPPTHKGLVLVGVVAYSAPSPSPG